MIQGGMELTMETSRWLCFQKSPMFSVVIEVDGFDF